MNEHAMLGKTIGSPSLTLLAENNLLPDQPKTITVTFEDERKALLNTDDPRAATWAQKIGYLQKNDRPVYVETDAGTGIITHLYVPEAARVWKLENTEEAVVEVSFHTSSALYYLNRNSNGFETMLKNLQEALDKSAPVLVTSVFNTFQIIDVRPLPSYFKGEEQLSEALQVPSGTDADKPVTPERAAALFKMMLEVSCIPCASTRTCIPFKYPPNGCWVRAHLMCYMLLSKEETPGKIWSAGKLKARSSNVPGCNVAWSWHVAATLLVKQKDGSEMRMVFDPSLSNQPETPEKWKALQSDPNTRLTYSSWEQYNHFGGTANLIRANSDMEIFRMDLDQMCREYGPSPYKCE